MQSINDKATKKCQELELVFKLSPVEGYTKLHDLFRPTLALPSAAETGQKTVSEGLDPAHDCLSYVDK